MPTACAAMLDAYCGNESNPELRVCYSSMRKSKVKIPLVAGFSGPGADRLRCYSPSDLNGTNPAARPLLQRVYTKPYRPCYITNYECQLLGYKTSLNALLSPVFTSSGSFTVSSIYPERQAPRPAPPQP